MAALAAFPLHARTQQPNEKAARVLEPLLKRPGSGPLFERFVNAWLDTATLEELEAFLAERVSTDPSPAHRLLLALFHSRQGKTIQALEQFRAALASEPGSADLWYQKALLESRTLDFEGAIASLGKCLGLKSAGELPLQAAQLLGRLQARAGRTNEALQTWRSLMESRPADEALREDILELLIAENLWPAAQQTAAALVESTADPYRRVLRRMRLGDVLDRAGHRDKALDTFAACLSDTGAGSWLEKEILGQIEKLFRREDDVSGLREYFTKLLETHAHRAGLQRAQARLLMEAGEAEAAIACGRTLMALSPGDRVVREEFIGLLKRAGRAAEAVPLVEQLLAQTPDDAELRITLADLKHAGKDTPGALAALRDYQQRAAGSDGTALRVASLMDRYGATPEAVQTLRASLERADQVEARQMLASLLHNSGKKDEALAEWKRIAATGALPAVQQAARAMQAHGESDAAWEMLQSAAAKAESDPVFLSQLCILADKPERAGAALPAARRLVELARSASDLNNALDAAQRVVRLSGRADEFIAELTASAATAQSLCLLATLREAARDTIGANEAIEKARAVSPELALAQLVRLWTMRGDFAQAATAAEALFNSSGGRQGHMAEMLASLHQRAGNPEAALHWTREWRKLVPGATAPVLAESRLLVILGRESEAFTSLRSAAGRFEGNEELRARLASLSFDTGRTAEALRHFSSLYEDAADLSAKMRWLGEWGEASQRAGQLENLIAQFEDRRRENRGSVAPLMALAELHRIADNYDARRNALTEAARLKPDDPEIALEIARLESRENNTEAAIRTLRPMLAKDQAGRVAALLADLLINSGQPEEGVRLLTESAAASPASVESAALSLARRDEESTALTLLQPHLAKYPGDGRLNFLAALIEWRTGAHEAAVARLLPLVNAEQAPARAAAFQNSTTAGITYDELIVRLMPADVQRCFRVLVEVAALNNSGNNTWNGYGRQSPYTSLPSGLEEMQDRAAALVMEMARAAAPELQAAWTAELERRGVVAARMLMDLPPLRRLQPLDRAFDFTPLLQEHPDSRPLLAIAALAAGYRQWNAPGDAAVSEKAWSIFRTDAPQAALYFALPGAGAGASLKAWENEVLAAAEQLENPSIMVPLAALRSACLLRSEDEFSAAAVSPGWRTRMVALLEKWRAAEQGRAQGYAVSLSAQVLRGMAMHYVQAKAAAPLAALLDSEWHRQSSLPQVPQLPGSDDALAAPLGFPPWFLPGLPDSLRDVMQRVVSPEAAALAAPLVQEPVLRLLLLSRAPGGAESAPAAAAVASGSSAVPYILAASWAEKRGDFAAAGEQAIKALYLPVSQEVRRRLDGALAYWASRKARPGDALHTAGREAVLRLRRDAVTDERRAELATLMDKLGLSEEADRLMRQGKAAAAASTPDERLERLLDEGRHKEALPPLLSDLRSWARQLVQSGSSTAGDARAAWRTRVQANGLLPQVLQAMLPSKPTPQQLAEYAAACDLTGDLTTARDYYERALAGGVRKSVPLLLLKCVIRSDRARSLALLAEFPDLWKKEAVQQVMISLVQDTESALPLEELIHIAGFFEEAVNEMPAAAAAEFPTDSVLEWVGARALAGALCHVEEVEDGNKVTAGDRVPAAERERAQALAAERLAACESLARRLVAIPGCGLSAWSVLEQCAKVRKQDEASLLSDGCAMLARELSQAPRPDRNDTSNGLSALVAQLMQTAATAGRTAEFAKVVVPAVRASRSPSAAEKLLETWPLYEPSAEQFCAAARAFVAKHGAKGWAEVIPAAALRRTGADLAPDLTAFYSRPDPKAGESGHYQFGQWCWFLEELRDRAVAEKFFHEVMAALLGPATERAAFFKDSKSPRLIAAQRLMGNLALQAKWTGFALRFARTEFIPFAPKEMTETLLNQHFSEQTIMVPLYPLLSAGDYAGAKVFLDSLPLTEDLATFFGGSGEMLQQAGRAFQGIPVEKFADLGLGGDGAGLTFGRLVVRGMADAWPKNFYEEMAGWEERIAAQPEPQRSLVMDLLRDAGGTPGDSASPGARAFYQWLHQERLAEGKVELERDVKKFHEDAAQRKFESDETLLRRLTRILSRMERGNLSGVRELMAAARGALTERVPGQTESALMELLTEQLGHQRDGWFDGDAAWLAALLADALLHGEPAAAAYGNDLSGIGRLLRSGDDTSVEGRLRACLERLAPVLQPGEARLLMLWLVGELPDSFGYRHLERVFSDGVRWAESQRGRCASEELRLEMEMALRFHLAVWKRQATEAKGFADETALPVEQRHYLTLLRDAALPAHLRLAMGTSMLDNGGLSLEPPFVHEVAPEYGRQLAQAGVLSLEPPFVHEVARLLHAALAERQPVRPQQEAEVFAALAQLPDAIRDAALTKSLLPLTTLPRHREQANEYEIVYGLVSLLDLALHAGDAATADRLLEMEGRFPGLGAVAVLARRGQQQRLADLLKDRPEVLRTDDDIYIMNQWNAALQSQLPAVLEKITDPVLRFEVLTRLTLFRDLEPPPAGLKPRAVRIEELANAFAAVPWKGLGARDRVLAQFFTWSEPAPEVLLPVIAESASRVPLQAIPFMDEDRSQEWTAFSSVQCSRALLAGDVVPLLTALRELRALPHADRDMVISVARSLLLNQRTEAVRRWPSLTPDTQVRLAADWLRVAAECQGQPWRDLQREQWQLALVLHALAGRMNELTAWFSALPETERVLLRMSLESQPLDDCLSAYSHQIARYPGTPAEHRARRLALFTALAANPFGCGFGSAFDDDYLAQEGATAEEFLQLEPVFTAARPDDGWLAAAFARVHASRSAWEQSLLRCNAALAKLKPERGAAYAPLLELRVQALEKMNRGAEAMGEIKALAELPAAAVPGPFSGDTKLSRAAEARLFARLR